MPTKASPRDVKWSLVTWFLAGFLIANFVAFVISLAATYALSPERHLKVTKEALAAKVFTNRPGVFEEMFGECALLEMQWLRQPDKLIDAIESKWVRPGPENMHPCAMLSIMLGVEPKNVKFAEPTIYYNYPFGPRYVMALGLSVLSVSGLRLIYEFISYASVLALLLASWSKPRGVYMVPIVAVLLFAFAQHGYAHNIAAAPAFIVIFLTLSALIAFREWFEPLQHRIFAMGALGAFLYYIDLSFSFLVALSLAPVVNQLFYVAGKKNYLRSTIEQGLLIVASIGTGYLLSMGIRILLMYSIHGVGLQHFRNSVGSRMSSQVYGTEIGIADVWSRLWDFLFQLTGSFSTAIVLILLASASWLIAVIIAGQKRSLTLWVDLLVLFVASAGIFAWYWLSLNHTYVHAFFMVRLLALPIAYGFVALMLSQAAPTNTAESHAHLSK